MLEEKIFKAEDGCLKGKGNDGIFQEVQYYRCAELEVGIAWRGEQESDPAGCCMSG